MKKFLCGSNYFFSCYPDYVWHDYDYIMIRENNETSCDYQHAYDFDRHIDYWFWKRNTPEWHVNHILNEVRFPLDIGHFLIPEVNKELGITIEHIKPLAPILDELWGKADNLYNYNKIIYDSYMENNSFTLTEEQRDRAYQVYKDARKDRYEK